MKKTFAVFFMLILAITTIGCVKMDYELQGEAKEAYKVLSVSGGYDLSKAEPVTLNVYLDEEIDKAFGYKECFYRISEESNGIVLFNFSRNALAEDGELKGLGTTDIMLIKASIMETDIFKICSLPVENMDSVSLTKAFNAFLESDRIITEEKTVKELILAGLEAKALPVALPGGNCLVTTGESLDYAGDISKLKVYSDSAGKEALISELGAKAVLDVEGDVYDALESGAANAAFLPASEDYENLGDIKYAVLTPDFGQDIYILAISEEVWENMDVELRRLLMDMLEDFAGSAAEESKNKALGITPSALEEGSGVTAMTMETLNPYVSSAIKADIERLWYEIISDMEEKGLPAKEIAAFWSECVQNYGGNMPYGIEEYLLTTEEN